MAGETVVTVVGRLTEAPELRFTPGGAAVASFTIASNARRFNKDLGQWEDEPPLFLRCSAWRDLAENAAESLVKGDQVIAQGNLVQRSYETREGEKRTVIELQVQELGAGLRFRKFVHQGKTRSASSEARAADPWAAGVGSGDEPPF